MELAGQVAAVTGGGAVFGGQPVLVGERGPELFIPTRAGRIASNQEMRASSGGTTVINMTVQTPDVASFRRSQGQIMADLHRQSEMHRARNGG